MKIKISKTKEFIKKFLASIWIFLKNPKFIILACKNGIFATKRFLRIFPKKVREFFFFLIISPYNNQQRLVRKKIKDVPTIAEIKEYQKYLRKKTFKNVFTALAAIMLIVAIPIVFKNRFAQSKVYGWTQSSWVGGVDTVSMANAISNLSNWTKFSSKSGNNAIMADANGISLTNTTATSATENGTTMPYTGVGSAAGSGVYQTLSNTVSLKKPAGATCGSDGGNVECDINICHSNSCVGPCDANIVSGQACTFGGLLYGVVTGGDGKLWLDRNLGATKGAMSINGVPALASNTDNAGFGWLFQWGRAADGHQYTAWGGQPSPVLSSTTTTLANSDTPGHADFITTSAAPMDWRDPQNDNLWQVASGVNNPCPIGFRVPTEVDWITLAQSSPIITNAASAFSSTLKIPIAGYRSYDGTLNSQGSVGYYWDTGISNSCYDDMPPPCYPNSTFVVFSIYGFSYGSGSNAARSNGMSIRCIKN